MPINTTVAFDTTVEYAIPLVALLTSTLMMWHEEHLRNSNVLQRVHLPNIIITSSCIPLLSDHFSLSPHLN
jgi:hypothetical protein